MRRMRFLSSLIFLLLPLAADAQPSSPYTPSDDAQILERLQRPSAAGADLRRMQAALAAAPQDLPMALAFARAAIAAGREEADPRYFGYAESALRPWWSDPAAAAEVVLMRATILQWRHDFDGATRDLDALIAQGGEGADQARLTRAVVRMVQGEPAAALGDCAALVGHTDLLTAATCIAVANSLRGRAQSAKRTLSDLLARAATEPGSASRLWTQTEAAEIAARLGEDAAAQGFYEQALAAMQASGHRDPYLLTSYADFLLDVQRPAAVLPLLADLTRIDNLLLRLALAESALAAQGDAQAARALATHADLLQARFAETRERGDFVHQREEAMFLLHVRGEPQAALKAALENWRKQREPLDARVLLEAALAAKQPGAAAPVLEWMQRTGIEDPRLHTLAAKLQAPEDSP